MAVFCSFCRTWFSLALLVATISFFLLTPHPASAFPSPSVPGEYIVKFKSGINPRARIAAKKVFGPSATTPLQLIGAELIRSQNKAPLSKEQIDALVKTGSIEYIEPNFIYSIEATPNDTQFGEQWGLTSESDIDIDAPEAWNMTTGSSEVVVGIIDTGIEYTHPDLAQNIWTNSAEIPEDGIDNDGNGYIDDVHGFNFLSNSGDPLDDHSHGTHCAGVIGAYGNNNQGISGINWRTKLMALKFLDASGSGSTAGAIAAIEYAVTMKQRGVNIRVLSNSWGGGSYSAALEDAISAASEADILFVAAAGNAGNSNDVSPTYPANYDIDNIISVAAVDSAGNLASFSNHGSQSVDVAAPGVSILSTVINHTYGLMSGTSMATPHVSGVAALLLSNEALATNVLKSRILQTAKPVSSLDGFLTYPAIVSAYRAITNTLSPIPPPTASVQYKRQSLAFESLNLGTKISEADDAYIVKPLGFNFRYFNRDYTTIVISTNGRVLLGDTAPTSPDYLNRLTEGLAVYHTDLTPPQNIGGGEGGVYFSGDDHEAVISWVMVPYGHRATGNETALVRIHVRLRSTGQIEYYFADTEVGDPGHDYGASATIGIAPPSGVSGQKLLVSENEANPDDIGSGRAISFSQRRIIAPTDFDGDGVADIAVWRPSSGMWYVLPSSASFDFSQYRSQQFGLPGDIPVPGDYDGDARADFAVWRPSDGSWYILNSSTSQLSVIQWGLSGDSPLPDDFDGDGRTDLIVERKSSGTVFGLLSSAGFDRDGALTGRVQALMTLRTGGAGYDSLTGDFSGDGKADLVSIWQLIRFWTAIDYSGAMLFSHPWGEPGDSPTACDRDGDGTADRIMSRVNSNNLLEHYTVTGSGAVFVDALGSLGDIPHCRDYDGDGKGDLTVYRPSSGEWYIRSSRTSVLSSYQFGLPEDREL